MPRQLRIDDFVPINDEEIDKFDEREVEESLQLSAGSLKIRGFENTSGDIPRVVAVDSSSLRLGETDEGLVVAVRVAIVIYEEGRATSRAFGPYFAHVTPTNAGPLIEGFRRILGVQARLDSRQYAPSLYKMADRLRNFVERIAQRYANQLVEDGILLWDGALTRSMDTPVDIFNESFRQALERGNSIVAISKSSRVWLVTNVRITELFRNQQKPCYCDIPLNIIRVRRGDILGHVHAVKFTPEGFTFRADTKVPQGMDCCKPILLLKKGVSFAHGYPEPLALAHITAYFTPAEGVALQCHVASKYDLEVVPEFDIRTHLFGPFGGAYGGLI